MLISSSMLKNSIEKYNNYKRLKETYKMRSTDGSTDGTNGGSANGETTTVIVTPGGNSDVENKLESDLYLVLMLTISFIFFVFEFLLLVIAVMVAVQTTTEGKERFVHLVLAVFYTMPYLLLMVLFNKKAQDYLSKKTSYDLQASCGWS